MRYVAAYLLVTLSGNASPDLKAIEKILSSVGIECDKDKANKVINELKGKSIADLIKEGTTKLASVPQGGGAAPAAVKAETKKEEKKEEKKVEKKKEESDDEGGDMGFGLFD